MRISLLKFEPKVSNFPVTESGKPVSVTTATGKVLARVSVMFVSFINIVVKKTFITYKKQEAKFFCGESNRSQGWLLLQVKIETKARFLTKRPQGLLATSQTESIFTTYFYNVYKYCSEKTFITYKKQEAKICSVVKVMEASDGFYYRQNLRLQAQILAKRPVGATGDLTNRKYFCFLLFIP